MKVAIVHDDFIQRGGAEKLIEGILEIFPRSDIFTSATSKYWQSRLTEKLPNSSVKTSFMQNLPLKDNLYKWYAPFYPIAFESLDLSGYDVVISSSARFSHGVITKPNTLHIAYINSPGRMFWESYDYFSGRLDKTLSLMISYLRFWDQLASKRPDYLVANSKAVQRRIRKYWKRDSKIIYPFYYFKDYKTRANTTLSHEDSFLVVSRLEKWKKIDIAIKACQMLQKKLYIVGEGNDFKRLKNMSNPKYVTFLGRLDEVSLIQRYINCCALIVTQKEDFGITSVECQSFGNPVIAFREGGALETIIEGETGVFYDLQTVSGLMKVLDDFDATRYKSKTCILNADRFSKKTFSKDFYDFVMSKWEMTK